jgi:hypothetical protein
MHILAVVSQNGGWAAMVGMAGRDLSFIRYLHNQHPMDVSQNLGTSNRREERWRRLNRKLRLPKEI